jgi:purine-binding chemotaxis protein CheW
MEIVVNGESIDIGVVADAVEEVLDLNAEQIEPPPRLGTRLNTEFIKGMGSLDEQFIILLDIDRVFTIDELSMFDVHE